MTKYSRIIVLFLFFAIPQISLAEMRIDDVSRLNETAVSEIRNPKSEADISVAVVEAQRTGKKISIAGRKHSQGGHIMSEGAIVLDMMSFNKIIGLNEDKTVLTVQSGATWAQAQDFLNREGLAVRVQQSSNIFTVGGSLSVNAHGRDPRFGPIVETVRSFRLVRPDGRIVGVSRTENPELFSLVIGGYGLFGIITEVSLDVTQDTILRKTTQHMRCADYPSYLQNKVLKDSEIELHYARPDITAGNVMENCSVTDYFRIADRAEKVRPLDLERMVETQKWLLSLSRKSEQGKAIRWFLQENLLDRPGRAEVISRNNALRPPVRFLDYESARDTDILQEYFIPLESAAGFMNDLRDILATEKINVLSITLRMVRADKESFLPYAAQDALAFVLYINHGRDRASVEMARKWTREIIDAALTRGGTYYLTYANHATGRQIGKAYPMLDSFFEKKREYDPVGVFTNKFYESYAP